MSIDWTKKRFSSILMGLMEKCNVFSNYLEGYTSLCGLNELFSFEYLAKSYFFHLFVHEFYVFIRRRYCPKTIEGIKCLAKQRL